MADAGSQIKLNGENFVLQSTGYQGAENVGNSTELDHEEEYCHKKNCARSCLRTRKVIIVHTGKEVRIKVFPARSTRSEALLRFLCEGAHNIISWQRIIAFVMVYGSEGYAVKQYEPLRRIMNCCDKEGSLTSYSTVRRGILRYFLHVCFPRSIVKSLKVGKKVQYPR